MMVALCICVEKIVADAIDSPKFRIGTIRLGNQSELIHEVDTVGVQSILELSVNVQVFHINFCASIVDLNKINEVKNEC